VLKEHLPRRAGDIRDSWADLSKAERILGYDPKTGLDEGLRRTVEFLRD
jgi:UDP-N-acetylglucosamine 4-epimerase